MEPSFDNHGECSHFNSLPNEIMKKIFSFLLEADLVRASGTSTKFFRMATEVGDCDYWKRAYQKLFEYRIPLCHPAPGRFEFRDIEKWEEEVNPWKASYKQLSHGVHVRPEYSKLYEGDRTGRNLRHFDSLEDAIAFLSEKSREEEETLIFLHSGSYDVREGITIDRNLQIVGAGPEPNDIAEEVQVKMKAEKGDAIFRFVEGVKKAYLGYVTIDCSCDSDGDFSFEEGPRAVEVSDQSSPIIEHCTMHNSSHRGAALYVRGRASPKVRNSLISDCKDTGIYITDQAEGEYINCEITRNDCGVQVNSTAKPVFKNCYIHHHTSGNSDHNHGMFVGGGDAWFEGCTISYNDNGIFVDQLPNLTVIRCDIYRNIFGVFMDDPSWSLHNGNERRIGSDDKIESRVLIESSNIHGNHAGIFLHPQRRSHTILRNNEMYSNEEDVRED